MAEWEAKKKSYGTLYVPHTKDADERDIKSMNYLLGDQGRNAAKFLMPPGPGDTVHGREEPEDPLNQYRKGGAVKFAQGGSASYGTNYRKGK